MAPSEQPQTSSITNTSPESTGIQTSSPAATPAEATSLPLPPMPQPPPIDTTQYLRQRAWLDTVLVVLVLLFAFLVASFPATNPDFFAHAATGRLILNGEYRFGVDPFVYSAEEGDYFVYHPWLFALLMYGLYQIPTIGGAVVVIFKALLIAALAVILLRTSRRPGQSLWIPAACTALAILALSPQLSLRSTCLSFLFLGATLWLLTAGRSGRKRLWWLLPPLFALWVNCDQWFFLGPLALTLYHLGETLQQQTSVSREPQAGANPVGSRPNEHPGELLTLGLMLVLGVAACLLNPHHIHAFTLPPEFGLTPANDFLENDPQFRALFFSPLRKDYYLPYLGLNPAGLAYWPLLLLSLASFVLVFDKAPWWRMSVWLGFALLSLYSVRAIAFFAIVSGPIMALNWQDCAEQLFGPEPTLTASRRKWSLGGRIFSVVVGLLLLLVTVPGWLHNPPQSRRLGWAVTLNPSLKAMAETIRSWREAGKLGPDEPHWFNMNNEVANYLAYFAPSERVYLDQGIFYFRKAAEDYEDIRQGLGQMFGQEADPEGGPSAKKDWQKILRDRHVHYWILDGFGSQKPEISARNVLFFAYKDWVLCYLKGSIAIFAWHDPKQPEAPDPSEGLALDLKRAAFGPEAEPAPPRGPEVTPPRNWWEVCLDVLWPAAPPRSIDADSAALYELRYLVEYFQQRTHHSRAWRAGAAASAIAGAPSSGPVPNNLLPLSWCWTYNDLFPAGAAEAVRQPRPSETLATRAWDAYLSGQFFESPSLYLALRASRRALLANPEDPAAVFRLGQIYRRLRSLPHERNFRASNQLLAAIRGTQMAGAFQECLRLPIDDDKAAQVHEALYDLFGQLGYFDATAHHLREALNKRKVAGPPPGMSVTQHNQRLEQLSDLLAKLDNERERRVDRFNVNAAGKSGLEKVRIALQERLAEIALEELEQADVSVSTPAEVEIIKQVTGVALDLGRLDKARQLLPDREEDEPIKLDDLELYVRLAAARGDYAEADRFLADALRQLRHPAGSQRLLFDRSVQLALLLGKAMLGAGQRVTSVPYMPVWPNNLADLIQRPMLTQMPSDFWLRRWSLEAIVNGMDYARQLAEWEMTRGWLALESGHCIEAREHFQTVRNLAVPYEHWIPEVNRLNNPWLFAPQEEIQRLNQLGLRHNILDAVSRNYLNWLVKEQ